jgi:PTS system nitrogen regulatory IIA component
MGIDIIDLVNEGLCEVNIKVKSKEDLLFRMATLFAEKYNHVSAEKIFNALMEREKLGSTGFGDGLAIPHTKLKNIHSFAVCIITLKKGVNFDSIDKKKVKIAIGILGPEAEEKQEEYLKLLARISKNIRDKNVLAEMLNAHSESVLKEVFIKSTISLDESKKPKTKNKLLIINLKEKKYFDDIIHYLLEKEITNAVVTDSTGVESFLADSPLFSGFLNFLADRSGSCKTIMVAVNEEDIPPLVKGIEDIMGNLDTHTGVQVMALDIGYIKGVIS